MRPHGGMPRRLEPRGGTAAPSERLIREVRRVIRAERVVDSLVDAACEAAWPRIRQSSRRAIAGECWWETSRGATTDFAYIVEHSKAGTFPDKRAAWIEALRGSCV
jgi:hypothetical protein